MSRDFKNIIQKLTDNMELLSRLTVTVGFDGFVDEITRVVKSREDAGNYTIFRTIAEFSAFTRDAAGKSADMELIQEEVKLGGNAPIMANALTAMGIDTVCIGAMGYPAVNKAFEYMSPRCKKISVCNPANALAFEFDDGKLMFANLKPLEELNWSRVKEFVGVGRLKKIFSESSLAALVNWSVLYNAGTIWEGIRDEIFKESLSGESGKTDYKIFFDLADPSKRTREDILAVLQLISSYSEYCNVTLGLNENEARRVFDALDGNNATKFEDVGKFIFDSMDIDTLLIHPIDSCIGVTGNGIFKRTGRFVSTPKISTGGGDNFNAGYCLGWLLGFNAEESMVIGMAASGAYVKKGYSPSFDELISYLEEWQGDMG